MSIRAVVSTGVEEEKEEKTGRREGSITNTDVRAPNRIRIDGICEAELGLDGLGGERRRRTLESLRLHGNPICWFTACSEQQHPFMFTPRIDNILCPAHVGTPQPIHRQETCKTIPEFSCRTSLRLC